MSQKAIVTNQTLYRWNEECTQLLNSSVLGILLRNGIKVFKNKNRREIESLNTDIREIQSQYMEMDENGNVIWDGEGQQRKCRMLPGKNMADFNAESVKLMEKKVTISI